MKRVIGLTPEKHVLVLANAPKTASVQPLLSVALAQVTGDVLVLVRSQKPGNDFRLRKVPHALVPKEVHTTHILLERPPLTELYDKTSERLTGKRFHASSPTLTDNGFLLSLGVEL